MMPSKKVIRYEKCSHLSSGCSDCEYKTNKGGGRIIQCLKCDNSAGREFKLHDGKCLIKCGKRFKREPMSNKCVKCYDYFI